MFFRAYYHAKKQVIAYRNGRANIEVTFRAPDGKKVTKRLIADTGAPLEFILSSENLELLKLIDAPDAKGGLWGKLEGAWVYLSMPKLETERLVVAYANEQLVSVARATGCDGIAGLKFLDEFKYSGDGKQFCLQTKRICADERE